MIDPALHVQHVPADYTVEKTNPGDFILTHTDHLTNKLIRFGQRLRFRGDNRRYAYWNHAALIVSDKGDIVEALGKGVERNHISKYTPKQYTIVTPVASLHDVEQMLKFAEWTVGQEYGFVTIMNLVIWTLVGGKLSFGLDGTEICSGLVARALERAGYIFERDPSHVMPADLARHFQVV